VALNHEMAEKQTFIELDDSCDMGDEAGCEASSVARLEIEQQPVCAQSVSD